MEQEPDCEWHPGFAGPTAPRRKNHGDHHQGGEDESVGEETHAAELLEPDQPNWGINDVGQQGSEHKKPQVHAVVAEGVAGDGNRRAHMPEQHCCLDDEDPPAVDAARRVGSLCVEDLGSGQLQMTSATHAVGKCTDPDAFLGLPELFV